MLLVLLSFALAADGPAAMPSVPTTAQVTNVYDGDTFTLTTGDKIRLKWVNTPERKPLEPYAMEARELTENFVMGKEITLITDGPNPRDGYGRILAGIRTDEGDLSEALLRAGYAHLFVIPPDSTDLTAMIAAQEEARAARRGIWSDEMFQGTFHITSFHPNAPGDDNTNVNGEYMRICNLTGAPADIEGWRLIDISGTTHRLPSVVVPAGQTVKVVSGRGPTGMEHDGQLQIHLNSDTPLWNNEHERVELYDPQGIKRDQRESHGKSH
ncbi:MAG: thermonuclease family protein [Myxococcales bacterium]|nr:thermonuclease family protein [Myxococcales bacterium]